jgi:hypothetical protein
MRYWIAGSGSWHVPTNWDGARPPEPEPCADPPTSAEPGAPQATDDVCIDAEQTSTVTYSTGTSTVKSLACRENLTIQAGSLTLSEDSFILRNLTMTAGQLTVNNELNIAGLFTWSGGAIYGSGHTTVTGGVSITGSPDISSQTLNLQCDTVASGGLSGNNFTIRNFAGHTYDHDGTNISVADGNSASSFVNEGTFVKSAGAGSTRFGLFVNNSGEMRVESGTLLIRPLTCTGSVVGLPGTTIELANGTQDFQPGSSLVGDHIHARGNATLNVRGIYDAGVGTSVGASGSAATVNFLPGANVIDYGDHLLVNLGNIHFEAVHGGPITFQTVTNHGALYFDSGDPVVTGPFIHEGEYWGSTQELTVNGLLTWHGGASFWEPGVIHANGGLLIPTHSNVRNLQRVLNNAGVATIQGPFANNPGASVNNLATGVWDIQADGNLITGSTLEFNNAGTLIKSAGTGTSRLSSGSGLSRPQINNTGTVEVQTGVLEFARSDYIQTAGQTVLNGGNLSMTGTAPGPLQINGGSLTGFGTVTGTVNNAGGSVEPGLSPGQLNITGNYTQSAAGSLEIELGGPTPGTDHDWLAVTGMAVLGGTLQVALIDGFIPFIGQQFTVLTAGSVGAAFTTVESLSPGLEINVIYNPTSVVLEITDAPLAGDCDDDGDVDLTDFMDYPGCLSGPGIPYGMPICECLDSNGDGAVDLRDFTAFQMAF